MKDTLIKILQEDILILRIWKKLIQALPNMPEEKLKSAAHIEASTSFWRYTDCRTSYEELRNATRITHLLSVFTTRLLLSYRSALQNHLWKTEECNLLYIHRLAISIMTLQNLLGRIEECNLTGTEIKSCIVELLMKNWGMQLGNED